MESKSKKILEELDIKIKSNFDLIEVKEINYGIQYKLKYNNNDFLLRLFYNNKGDVKFDYSTIKSQGLKSQIVSILEGANEDLVETGSISNQNMNEPNQTVDFSETIGTDESGKGDYFGPLVTASVWVNRQVKEILDRNGIQDSKKISDSRIYELAQIIKKNCNGRYVVIELPPNTYNKLYTKFKSEGKNLNVLLAWSHAKAIEELLDKVECGIAISDQFADESFIINKLQEKGRTIKLIQEHKAEKYTSVAAASILARERFLEKLKRIRDEYSIDFSKGASNLVVEQAREFVRKYGKEQLTNIAKLHFKTTEQVYE